MARQPEKISEACQRFLELWWSGVRDPAQLARECATHERTVFRWIKLLRTGKLDRFMKREHRVQPDRKPALVVGPEEQATPDHPDAMDPPSRGRTLGQNANTRREARSRGKHDDTAEYGKAPTKGELIETLNEFYGPDFVKDPGPDWDPMGIVRRAALDPRVKVSDRLKAAEICERRRQFDITRGVGKAGKVNWRDIVLADIPPEEVPRLFGLLAERMQQARAPFLGAADTTPEQEAVFFALGLQVHADDAPRVLAELAPARAAAVGVAKALTEARQAPPPDITPVDPQDYLDHVPPN